MLEGVLGALDARGLGAGTDIALVTSDEVGINRVHRPPLTAISRDAFGLGVAAASILVRQLAVDVAPETVILPVNLIGGSRARPSRDPHLSGERVSAFQPSRPRSQATLRSMIASSSTSTGPSDASSTQTAPSKRASRRIAIRPSRSATPSPRAVHTGPPHTVGSPAGGP